MTDAPDLVDYAYIAERLNLSRQTVRAYGTGTRQKKEGFPENVAPATARSPLFLRAEADAFIEQFLATSKLPALLKANRDVAPAKPAVTRSDTTAKARANAKAKRDAEKSN